MSENSPYYSPILFLTEQSLEKELYQKIVEMLDFSEGRAIDNEGIDTYDNVAQYYNDLIYKYSDLSKLSDEALKSRIEEAGYESLLNVLNYTQSTLVLLAQYLPLLKILKGSKAGIELILEMICSDYIVEEWWEDEASEPAPECTYTIDLMRLLNASITKDIVDKFVYFSRKYVYPVLISVTVGLQYKYRDIYTHCYPRVKFSVKMKAE